MDYFSALLEPGDLFTLKQAFQGQGNIMLIGYDLPRLDCTALSTPADESSPIHLILTWYGEGHSLFLNPNLRHKKVMSFRNVRVVLWIAPPSDLFIFNVDKYSNYVRNDRSTNLVYLFDEAPGLRDIKVTHVEDCWLGRFNLLFKVDNLPKDIRKQYESQTSHTSIEPDDGSFSQDDTGAVNFNLEPFQLHDGVRDAFWICRRCDDRGTVQLFNAAATTSAAHHLRQAHRIHKEMPATSSDSSQNSPMPSDPEDDESEAPVSKRARTQATTVISRAQVQQAEELALGFIINSDQPFNIFSDSFLHHLLILHNPALCAQIAWGRTTLRERLSRCFKIKKDIIRKEMMDRIWALPRRQRKAAAETPCSSPAAWRSYRLKPLLEPLSDCARVGVVDRIGVVIADNASNNDTCLQEFFQILDPSIQGYEAEERRIRCYGHILNLVGRAFLYGEDSEAFEQESQAIEQFGHLDDILRFWRRKGPVGKLHNIVKWVRSSPQRSEYFQRCIEEDLDESSFTLHRESTHELELVLNNETRWNSTYLMIDRAILKRDDVEAFLIKNQLDPDFTRRIPSDDVLVAEDWKLLVELRDALEPLYRQTMRCQGWSKQGSFGCLWEVLPGMEYILEKLEDWKAFFDDNTDSIHERSQRLDVSRLSSLRQQISRRQCRQPTPSTSPQAHSQVSWSHQDHHTRFEALPPDSRQYFRLSVMNTWKKLNEYYAKLGNSPLFAAAVILHPRLGISWLEGQWDDPEQLVWIHNAKAGLYRFWKRWYSQEEREQSGDSKANHLRDPQQVPRSQQQEMSAFDQWVYSRPARLTSNDSEIDKYLSHEIPELQRGENPVLWWLAHKGTYPTLHKLALDIFAIPAMAADCERAFSLAKLTLTSQRLAMDSSTLEQIQCLKNWIRRGAILLGGVS
ncbi:hypothetical protein PG995_004500 [Apiospora arundinis]